jgi:phosphoribosylanthranilate isomerase
VKIKVCGITRPEDAVLAADLGAWAVGFIFWPGSPRSVEASAAREIASRLPPQVERVGVFVDQPPEHVENVARAAGLSLIQLHGREPPAYARALTRPVIKAVSLAQVQTPGGLEEWADAMLMLDGREPDRPEAGGRRADWTAAARIAARRPLVLAGGLRPDNVREAVGIVRPHALDVSSGIERAPGVKDPALMRDFFAAVAEAARGV